MRRLFVPLLAVLAIGGWPVAAMGQDASAIRELNPVVRLTPEDPDSAGHFGASLAFDGTTLVVGTPRSHMEGLRSGSVHFLSLHGGRFVWDQEYVVPSEMYSEIMGGTATVAGSFSTISSGAMWGTSESIRGWVRLFVRDENGWQARGRLSPGYPESDGAFGSSVVIVGRDLAVGASWTSAGDGTRSGSVLVYSGLLDESGRPPTRLAIPVTGENIQFGNALAAADDDTMIVAAAGASVAGHEGQGAVLMYRRTQTGWVPRQEITLSDGQPYDYFGREIAASGNTLLIGSYTPGYVKQFYVFNRHGDSWEPHGTLPLPPSGVLRGPVAIEGGWAAIGGWMTGPSGIIKQNTVWIYRLDGAGWGLQARTTAPEASQSSAWIGSVAIHDTALIVGIPQATLDNQEQKGVVYVYSLEDTPGIPVEDTGSLTLLAIMIVLAGLWTIRFRSPRHRS